MEGFRVAIFQEDGLGEQKIAGISAFGEGIIISDVFDFDSRGLPHFIDEPELYIRDDFDAHLVLVFVNHPDIMDGVVRVCNRKGVVCVVPGRRVLGAICPPTCCSLERDERLGKFGERFGLPELRVSIEGGIVCEVDVVRGAPCGSTWVASKRIIGLSVSEAIERFPREIQYLCYRKSVGVNLLKERLPVHIAGEAHYRAIIKAIKLTQN